MVISRFARGLLALGITSLLGCGVTMAELQAENPQAATLQVHCHPWQIPKTVRIFAVRSSGDSIYTDETPGELRDFAKYAGAFIEVNTSAPPENAQIMASHYGLICEQEPVVLRSTPLESLRPKEPSLMAANASANRHLMGATNSQPSNSGAGGSTKASGPAPAALPRIGVCAIPPGIKGNEWHGGPGIKANVKTQAEHDAQVAKATVVFYLDATAPPESIWHFGPNTKVRCPGKAPIPYDEWVAKHSGSQQSGNANAATGTSTTATATTKPNAGSSLPATPNPNGQGPALSVFERIVNNMAVGGALAQGDTSGNLDDPNGHRNGIPGGKNVGGFSFPLLQAGVATFQIISAIGVSPKNFVDLVHIASKKGQRTIIKEADTAALKLADDLIQNHGQYPMAAGLEEMQTIMPYALGEKFTKGLGNKFQAHKIFERQALKRWKGSDVNFEKLPSVILTNEEHKNVTKLLNDAWKQYGPRKAEELVTVEQLRKIYRAAYQAYPHWLEIVESQLR